MSKDIPNRRPNGTFEKGFTANRGGAPLKSKRKRPETAFDVLLEEEFDPVAKDLPEGLAPVHEAAWRTFVAALKGNSKRARRTVLKHIERRETERVRLFRLNEPIPRVKELLEPNDPQNVDDALLILGIAGPDEQSGQATDKRLRLKLLPWAVQAALGRRHGGKRLTKAEIEDITRLTADSAKIAWPRGYGTSLRKSR